jgi:hypothetical protein
MAPITIRDRGDDIVGDGIDLPRVLANHKVSEFVHRGFSGRDETVNGRFTDTVNLTVSRDLHEQPVLPSSADGIGFKLDDLQSGCPRCLFPETSRAYERKRTDVPKVSYTTENTIPRAAFNRLK